MYSTMYYIHNVQSTSPIDFIHNKCEQVVVNQGEDDTHECGHKLKGDVFGY